MSDLDLTEELERIQRETQATKRKLAELRHKMELVMAVQSLKASQTMVANRSNCASLPFAEVESAVLHTAPPPMQAPALDLIGIAGAYDGVRLRVEFDENCKAMVGRGSACSMQLELDAKVSDVHCQFVIDPASCALALSAICGSTHVNAQPVAPFRFVSLRSGDKIALGLSTFHVMFCS